MPRSNMSCSHTKEQVRARKKYVTRLLGWANIKPGDVINLVEKGMGLKKGEKVVRLARVKIEDVRPERLDNMYREPYGSDEALLEGVPELSGVQFVEMFCKLMKCQPYQMVNRIEFGYLDSEDES